MIGTQNKKVYAKLKALGNLININFPDWVINSYIFHSIISTTSVCLNYMGIEQCFDSKQLEYLEHILILEIALNFIKELL